VLKKPMAEYMRPLVEMGLAQYITDVQDIDWEFQVEGELKHQIFAEPSPEKVRQILNLC